MLAWKMSSSPQSSPSLYSALAEGVRVWVDAKGWTDFSEIQARAIPRILDGEGALIMAPTASGKTEAALLPIVSRIIEERAAPVALLYVAPLRALINDQARRIVKLVEECSLTSAWWHGDLPPAARKRILANPPHALLTTPESIEVLLSGESYGHGAILGNARFVLIDEIHAFAASDRGAQLVSLLARLEAGKRDAPVRVALSATIGSPLAIAQWFASARQDAPPISPVTEDGRKGRKLAVGLIPRVENPSLTRSQISEQEQARLADVLARHAYRKRVIVFAGSRRVVERLTMDLRERDIDALIHHASLDLAIRRANEERFQQDGPKTIVATSTLELGIDIGDLETVIQVGVPPSVSTLLQRVGRSGRRAGASSVGILYATDLDQLPLVLAAGELALENVVEPLEPARGALHVAFQQLVNLVRERDIIDADEAISILSAAGSFNAICDQEWTDLVDELVQSRFLERDRTRLQIGAAAERAIGYANYRDFYSVFETDDVWTVRTQEETIGTLDLTFPVSEGRDVFFVLGGRRWKVEAVDRERRVLRVLAATSGPIPYWQASGGEVSYEIMRRSCALLVGKSGVLESPPLTAQMDPLRKRAQSIGLAEDRFIVDTDALGYTHITTFLGSEINYYLGSILGQALATAVNPSAEDLSVNKNAGLSVEEISREMRAILGSSERRAELEEAVLTRDDLPGVGKYWTFFGPKTRRHVLRHALFASSLYGERLKDFSVVATRSSP